MKFKKVKSIIVMLLMFASIFFIFTPNVTSSGIEFTGFYEYTAKSNSPGSSWIEEIEEGKSIVTYVKSDANELVGNVFTVSNDIITYHNQSTVIFESDADKKVQNFVKKIDTNKILCVGSSDSDTDIKATILTIESNNNITIGNVSTLTESLDVAYPLGSIAKINSTAFALAYQNDTNVNVVLGRIETNNNITWGTPVYINETAAWNPTTSRIGYLEAGKLIVLFTNTLYGSSPHTAIVTYSGLTPTKSEYIDRATTTNNVQYVSFNIINSTHFIVGMDQKAVVGVVDDENCTFGAIKTIGSTEYIKVMGVELAKINTNAFIWTEQSDVTYLLTIDGTTITKSELVDSELDDGNTGFNFLSGFYGVTNKFVVLSTNNDTNEHSMRVGSFIPNDYPVQSNPDPDDESTSIEATPTLNITINDAEGDSMTITWLSNSSGSWVEFGSNSTVGNGTYHQENSNFSGSETTYYWSANVTDGNFTNATYSFTTAKLSSNSNPDPANEETDVELGATLYITVNDSNGDTMNVTFRTNGTGGGWGDIATNSSVTNGTYSQYNDGSPLNAYDTKYWWSVNTTDGTTWSNDTYYFTTVANSAPVNDNPEPDDEATDTDLNPTLYINVSDAESHDMDVHWWTNATGSWVNFHTDSGVGDTTQNAVTSDMDELDTEYWWSVNTSDDNGGWDNDTYSFTTTATSPNPVNSVPNPTNAATDQPLDMTTFGITVTDPNGDEMDIYLRTNSTGTWTTWKSWIGGTNDSYTWIGSHDPYFTDLTGNTTYYWSVNTTDGENWDNDTYYFTTNHSYSMTITKTANISTVNATDTEWNTQLVNYTINVTNTGTGNLTDININETWWNCSCNDWKFWFVSTNEPNWETNLTVYTDSCYMSINITNLSAGESYELYILLNVSECDIDTTGTLRNWANVTATYAPSKSSYCDIYWGSPPVPATLGVTIAQIVIVFITVVVIMGIAGMILASIGRIKW